MPKNAKLPGAHYLDTVIGGYNYLGTRFYPQMPKKAKLPGAHYPVTIFGVLEDLIDTSRIVRVQEPQLSSIYTIRSERETICLLSYSCFPSRSEREEPYTALSHSYVSPIRSERGPIALSLSGLMKKTRK